MSVGRSELSLTAATHHFVALLACEALLQALRSAPSSPTPRKRTPSQPASHRGHPEQSKVLGPSAASRWGRHTPLWQGTEAGTGQRSMYGEVLGIHTPMWAMWTTPDSRVSPDPLAGLGGFQDPQVQRHQPMVKEWGNSHRNPRHRN